MSETPRALERPDPLIDEVRARRSAVLAALGNDLQRYFEAIRELEAQHPEKVGDPRPARPNPARHA